MSGSPASPRVAGFLVAEAVSAIGSWATIVAIWGYAAYEYDATPAEVSLFGIAFSVPGILLGPARRRRDRPHRAQGDARHRQGARRRRVAGPAPAPTTSAPWPCSSALHGVASTFSHPALQSMPPRLVDDEHVARTNALVSLTDELAIVLGPVAAGIGIAAFGFRGRLRVRRRHLRPRTRRAAHRAPATRVARRDASDAEARSSRLRYALEGWRLIARTGVLRRIVTCTFAVHLLYGTALLAEPLYVRDVLERSPSVFAALQTAFGVCLVVGRPRGRAAR